MARRRDQRQQAQTKGKRKAAEDPRPTTREKRRKTGNQETTIPSEKQTTIESEKQNPESRLSKRKRGDDGGSPLPRKRSKTEVRGPGDKIQHSYREPQGARKSRRIAGQPADASGTVPGGQYAQQVEQGAVSPEMTSEDKLQEVHEARDQQPDIPDVPNSSRLHDDSGRDDEGEEQASEPVQTFLKLIANNIGSHRVMQLLTSSYKAWAQRITDLKNGQGGLNEVQADLEWLLRNPDRTQEDLEHLRTRRRARLEQLEGAQDCISALIDPMNDLNAKQASRNERMYAFTDVPKNSSALEFLPDEFWSAFDDCILANTACKDIEQEIQESTQKQLDVFQQLDEQTGHFGFRDTGDASRNLDAIGQRTFEETFEEVTDRLHGLSATSRQLGHLKKNLDAAKDTRYDQESKLMQIAEGAFIAAGFMSAVTGLGNGNVLRRTTDLEASSKQDSTEKGQLRTESRNPLLTAEYIEKSEIASKVCRARDAVEVCEGRLEIMRCKKQMSDASSTSPDAQGRAHMREMIKRTQEVREAQDTYREMMHDALDRGAVSRSCQESYFEDRSSDGYNDSDLADMDYPLPEAKADRVKKWAGSIGRSRNGSQTTQGAGAKDKEGSWVEGVPSLDLDEGIYTRHCSSDRLKELTELHKRACEHLRATAPFENAENDFHPKNNPAYLDGVQINHSSHRIPTQLDAEEAEIHQSGDKSRVPSGRGSQVVDNAVDGYEGENADGIE